MPLRSLAIAGNIGAAATLVNPQDMMMIAQAGVVVQHAHALRPYSFAAAYPSLWSLSRSLTADAWHCTAGSSPAQPVRHASSRGSRSWRW